MVWSLGVDVFVELHQELGVVLVLVLVFVLVLLRWLQVLAVNSVRQAGCDAQDSLSFEKTRAHTHGLTLVQ